MANLKNTSVVNSGDFKLPSGTTAQRPSNPQTGMLRFNTDAGVMEVYDGTQWDTTTPPYKYYDENRFASIWKSNWDDNTLTYMDDWGDLGQGSGHGWSDGPVDWTFTLNDLPPHMFLSFKVRCHLIDTIDNENNRIFLADNDDNLFQIIDFERDFSTPIFTNSIDSGTTFEPSGEVTYSIEQGRAYDSYATITYDYYYHTRSDFRALFDIGVDQDQDDEAFYITNLQVYLK